MQDLLRNPRAMWGHFFERAVVGIAIVDKHGRFIKANPKLQDILGYTEFELQKITFQDITLPSDIEADEEALAQVRAGDIPSYTMKKRYITKDGRVIWIRLTVHPQFSKELDPSIEEDSSMYFISQIEEILSTESKLEKLVEKQIELIEHHITEVYSALKELQKKDKVEKPTLYAWLDRHMNWLVPILFTICTISYVELRNSIRTDYEREMTIKTVVEQVDRLQQHEPSVIRNGETNQPEIRGG